MTCGHALLTLGIMNVFDIQCIAAWVKVYGVFMIRMSHDQGTSLSGYCEVPELRNLFLPWCTD